MNARSNSLAAALKRVGRFDEYFAWCAAERPSWSQRLEKIRSWEIKTSSGSINRLHRSGEALAWRLKEAAESRANLEKMLPSDLDAAIKESLLRQRFDSTLGELTHKELMDHLTIELEERKMRLKEKTEPEKLRLAERRVVVAEKKIADAQAVLENTSVPMKEREARLKQIFSR